jgi:hypothetical protein
MITIDGKDIKQEYGCTLLWGSFDSLLRYPKRKAVEYNNWAEMDGIEPDLFEVLFEPRKIQLNFIQESGSVSAFWAAYNKLYSDMTMPGYRVLKAIDGMTNNIRLDASSKYSIPQPFNESENRTLFTLDFIEDVPDVGESYMTSGSGNAPLGLYSINGEDFGNYGIGADERENEIVKYPSLKPPFTDGRTVFLDSLKTAHKEIKLNLWMLAGSVSEFINNYRAFFTQFNQPGTQSLYLGSIGITASVYYVDCTAFKIERWGNRVSVRFTISLVVPRVTWVDKGGVHTYNVLRDKGTNSVLANEQGKIIVMV